MDRRAIIILLLSLTTVKSAIVTNLFFYENFGNTVTHQLISWPVITNGWAFPIKCTNSSGIEYPLQIIEGGTAICTIHTNIIGFKTNEFFIFSDTPTAYGGGEFLGIGTNSSGTDYWNFEITNKWGGLRLANPNYSGTKNLAPIQGLRNGPTLATGFPIILTNNLQEVATWGAKTWTNAINTWYESGPLIVKIGIKLQFVRNEWAHDVTIPAAPVEFNTVLIMHAYRHSAWLDTNLVAAEICYRIPTESLLTTDQVRWRGHSATSTDFGYIQGGGVYSTANNVVDAYYNITAGGNSYDIDYAAGVDSGVNIIRVATPFEFTTGVPNNHYYGVLCVSNGAATSPAPGYISGRAGNAIGAQLSGCGFYSSSDRSKQGIVLKLMNRSGSGVITTNHNISWGIYFGTNGSSISNVTTAYYPQPLIEANYWAGISYRKLHSYFGERNTNDLPQYGSPFLSHSHMDNLKTLVRGGDTVLRDYLKLKGNYTAYTALIVDMWADGTGAETHETATNVYNFMYRFIDRHSNLNGLIENDYNFLQGGQQMMGYAIVADQILADSLASTFDRYIAKRCLSIWGNLLQDEDFYYLNGITGDAPFHYLSAGSGNFIDQYKVFRAFYQIYYTNLCGGLLIASNNAFNSIPLVWNPYGAIEGSSEYMEALGEPTMMLLLCMKEAGYGNFFTNQYLLNFGQFLLNYQTTLEPRFGNVKRKLIAVGDGNYKASPLLALAPSCFAGVDDVLSARLQEAWRRHGTNHQTFYAPGLVLVNESLPATNLNLISRSYPGYMDNLRNYSETTNESSVHGIWGNWYTDHRTEDQGNLYINLLGTVVASQFGTYPYSSEGGANIMNTVQPISTFTYWNGTHTSLALDEYWTASTNGVFLGFPNSGKMIGVMTNTVATKGWTRTVVHSGPIVWDVNSFTDTTPYVYSINSFGTGAVVHALGNTTPTLVLNQNDGVYPQTTVLGKFDPGFNKFAYTGQWWNQHPSLGLDWSMNIYSGVAVTGAISQFAHASTTTTEGAEFLAANGRSFTESQYTLRLQVTNAVENIVSAWRKNAPELKVFTNTTVGNYKATNATDTFIFNSSYLQKDTATLKLLTAFVDVAGGTNKINITGGPAEVAIGTTNMTFSAAGTNGTRYIRVTNGIWAKQPSLWSRGRLGLAYTNGDTVTLNITSSNSGGFASMIDLERIKRMAFTSQSQVMGAGRSIQAAGGRYKLPRASIEEGPSIFGPFYVYDDTTFLYSETNSSRWASGARIYYKPNTPLLYGTTNLTYTGATVPTPVDGHYPGLLFLEVD